jgi:ADP-heptose:LPS heptosyltransferase
LKNGKIGKEVSDYFSSFDLIIAYISDPERTVSENLRKTGAKRVLTHPPFPKGDDLHAADYTALILQETGLSFNPPLFPKIHLNEEDLDFAHEFLYPFMQYRPLIAIHPRTFGIKGLPIGKFINIGKWIENTMGGKTIWITGQAEEENIDLIKSNFPSSPLLHLYSLSKVSATLSLSNLYFGCDTGISHLAAAAGARVLALFGPTNPHVWGPRGKRVWIIKADEMSTFEEYKVKDIIIFIYNKSKEVEENKIYSYQELLNAT